MEARLSLDSTGTVSGSASAAAASTPTTSACASVPRPAGRRRPHGGDDLGVAGAAAEVAGQRLDDLLLGGPGGAPQQGGGADQQPGGAEAALDGAVVDEGPL